MEIADFLRARYDEAQKREEGKRRSIPSPFDDHRVEVCYQDGETTVLVDGQSYPTEQYWATATEPAADQFTLDDLAAKRRIIERHQPHSMGGCRECTAPHWGVKVCNHCQRSSPCPDVRDLARPYRDHPDFEAAWLED